MLTTPKHSLAGACYLEHQILEHVKGALRVTVDWRESDISPDQQRESMRFALGSFCRHLERLMRIEEEGGYLSVVSEVKPHLQDRINRLAFDHETFRVRIQKLRDRIDTFDEWDSGEFEQTCEVIRDLLEDVDQHDHAEVVLLQEALVLDEGGEG